MVRWKSVRRWVKRTVKKDPSEQQKVTAQEHIPAAFVPFPSSHFVLVALEQRAGLHGLPEPHLVPDEHPATAAKGELDALSLECHHALVHAGSTAGGGGGRLQDFIPEWSKRGEMHSHYSDHRHHNKNNIFANPRDSARALIGVQWGPMHGKARPCLSTSLGAALPAARTLSTISGRPVHETLRPSIASKVRCTA